MHKTKSVNKNNSSRHLKLVRDNSTVPNVEQPSTCSIKPLDSHDVNFLTQAMMNRLWIPQSSSIVGLLNVRPSRDNLDELSKWIRTERMIASNEFTSVGVQHLEKRFRNRINSYPEF